MNIGTSIGIGAVLALIAAIVVMVLITPNSKEGQLHGFAKFLRDYFLMRYLVIESILRFIFILSTCACIFCGFFLLFGKTPSFYGYGGSSTAGAGLLIMVLGPIFTRISYEFMMITIMLLKNTMEINAKMKGDVDSNTFNAFKAPDTGKIVSSIANAAQQATAKAAQETPVNNAANSAPVAPVNNMTSPAPAAPAGNAAQENVKICPKCGANVVEGSLFCVNCGTKID